MYIDCMLCRMSARGTCTGTSSCVVCIPWPGPFSAGEVPSPTGTPGTYTLSALGAQQASISVTVRYLRR